MQLFTDAEEIKAVNKQINALQEEFGRLRERNPKPEVIRAVGGKRVRPLRGEGWVITKRTSRL